MGERVSVEAKVSERSMNVCFAAFWISVQGIQKKGWCERPLRVGGRRRRSERISPNRPQANLPFAGTRFVGFWRWMGTWTLATSIARCATRCDVRVVTWPYRRAASTFLICVEHAVRETGFSIVEVVRPPSDGRSGLRMRHQCVNIDGSQSSDEP